MADTVYNLSVGWPDGETIVGMISPNKPDLVKFLKTYWHEAGYFDLVRKDMTAEGSVFSKIDDDNVLKELGECESI